MYFDATQQQDSVLLISCKLKITSTQFIFHLRNLVPPRKHLFLRTSLFCFFFVFFWCFSFLSLSPEYRTQFQRLLPSIMELFTTHLVFNSSPFIFAFISLQLMFIPSTDFTLFILGIRMISNKNKKKIKSTFSTM